MPRARIYTSPLSRARPRHGARERPRRRAHQIRASMRARARRAIESAARCGVRARVLFDAPPGPRASVSRACERAPSLARTLASDARSMLLSTSQRERIARDLRRMAVRKMDGDGGAHGRRVALVPLGTYNEDPCVVVTVTADALLGGKSCALPSAAVEDDTLLESSSVATTSAARRARDALFGAADDARVELLGASHDVVDAEGRTVVTPVIAYFGEIAEKVRGRSDVAAISLETLMSLDGVIADPEGGSVRFIGTLAARGLRGYEAQALHNALRVVAGPNKAYKEALYDQFNPAYVRSSPPAPPNPNHAGAARQESSG